MSLFPSIIIVAIITSAIIIPVSLHGETHNSEGFPPRGIVCPRRLDGQSLSSVSALLEGIAI